MLKSNIGLAHIILKKEGLGSLLRYFLKFVHWNTLRGFLPQIEFEGVVDLDGVKFSNIPVDNRGIVGDGILGSSIFGQDAEVHAHEKFTNTGDDVVIIGGGYGITTVHAAKQTGESGSVLVYEGGGIANHIREICKLNDVEKIVTVKEAIVGEAYSIYDGVGDDVPQVLPSNLPRCDVLEMDCEGSELGIIKNLEIRPRVLILELHPQNYTAPNKEPVRLIREMSYVISHYSTQSGVALSEREFISRLEGGEGDVLIAEFRG